MCSWLTQRMLRSTILDEFEKNEKSGESTLKRMKSPDKAPSPDFIQFIIHEEIVSEGNPKQVYWNTLHFDESMEKW